MSSHSAKSNVFSLSKEYSDSEKTIRSQMVVANVDGTEKSGEEIWLKEGYFGKLNPEFNCHKNDFPENCLLYINQAYLTFKDRKSLIYCDYAVLGQIVPFNHNLNRILTNLYQRIINLLKSIHQVMI